MRLYYQKVKSCLALADFISLLLKLSRLLDFGSKLCAVEFYSSIEIVPTVQGPFNLAHINTPRIIAGIEETAEKINFAKEMNIFNVQMEGAVKTVSPVFAATAL